MKTYIVIISVAMLLVGGCSSRNMAQNMAWQGVARQLLAQGGVQNMMSSFGVNSKQVSTKSTSTPVPTKTAEQKAAEAREQNENAMRFLSDLNNIQQNAESMPEVQKMRAITGEKAPNATQDRCYNWCNATYGGIGNSMTVSRCFRQCDALYE